MCGKNAYEEKFSEILLTFFVNATYLKHFDKVSNILLETWAGHFKF